MSTSPQQSSPEQDLQYHTYVSHTIPWYVRFIWILFWIFAIGYVVKNFLPAIQTELLSPP